MGLYSQNKSMELSNSQLNIARATDLIEVDGILEETSWEIADRATDFWMQFPNDDSKAQAHTEIRMTCDDKKVYIAAICYDVEEYVAQTLKRGVNLFEDDAIGVVIDPVNNNWISVWSEPRR